MGGLVVAVCTNRPPAAWAAALDALAATPEVDRLLLVLSGVEDASRPAQLRAAARLARPVEILHESLPGLARARNRALAACSDDDWLAFVDDDAVVSAGWGAAVRGAWERASPRVACLGGPIRPRFAAPRPRWLDDRILAALTVLDYGPVQLDLDPRHRALYGANVSFRVGPLRRVGGFDPRRGHVGERIGFSEEDAVQRSLHGAGLVVRYEPAAWVWHVIGAHRLSRRAVLARRLAYGQRLGADRARPPALALRQGMRSAVGAPVAALQGRDGEAMVRAVRVVENAGVLLGSLRAAS